MSGVVGDHHQGALLTLGEHPLGQRGGDHPHQHPVHAERARTHGAPDAGRPEGEPAVEPAFKLGRVAGQEGLQLRARVGVGVGGQPLGGPPAHVPGHNW